MDLFVPEEFESRPGITAYLQIKEVIKQIEEMKSDIKLIKLILKIKS